KKSPSSPRYPTPASGSPLRQIQETCAVGARYIGCLAESGSVLETLARRDGTAWPAPRLRRRFWRLAVPLLESCLGAGIRLPATPDACQFLLPVPPPLWSLRKGDKTSERCVAGVSRLRLLKQDPFHQSRHSSPRLRLLP